ncbi:hypothetical protein Vi05172_g1959 [Venturia inaequalis]|nr:hypothetical protein Vi05172_g1959 [Venturia inaequalis]
MAPTQSKIYRDQEEDIQEALEALSKDPALSMAALARKYNIDYHRLNRRKNGTPSKLGYKGANQRLNPT